LMGVRPSVDQVESIIAKPKPTRGKTMDYAALVGKKFRTKK
jgi:hypothetical protein